jgi:hypothetical protein
MKIPNKIAVFDAAYVLKRDLADVFNASNVIVKPIDRYEGRVKVLDLEFYGNSGSLAKQTLLFTLKNVYKGITEESFLE